MVKAGVVKVAEEIQRQVEDLHARYLRVVDEGLWEEWPALFTETCLYKIVTRENFDSGLPLSVMECHSRGMLQDRVTGLRTINVFEPHRYLHQSSGLSVESAAGGRVQCKSNYLVIRTMLDGSMSIFSCGVYLDKIVLTADGARFEERLVVADSRRIETLLVLPL
jgi:anthranilate 1,2-dioxygenase small subunit